MANLGKLIKTLGVAQGNILSPHIDIFLADNNDFAPTIKVGGVKVDDGHFHPSSHALMDEEALFKDRQDSLHQRISAAEKKTFDCGHMWHGYIQAALVEMGFVKKENVERHILRDLPAYDQPFPLTTKVSGTIDLHDLEIPGRGTWLVDIKTAGAGMFNSIEQTDLFKKYLAQVNLYGDMVGQPNMLILIVQKDSPHLFREIQIQRDPDLLFGIYTKWIRVAERLLNETS